MPSKRNKGHSKNKQQTSPTKKNIKSSSSGFTRYLISLSVLCCLLAVAFQYQDKLSPINNGAPASTKPYSDVSSFYPFYLTQHVNPICQKLHVGGTSIILLVLFFSPATAISMAIGVLSGYISFPLFRNESHGAYEAFIMFFFALLFSRLLHVHKYLLACLLIGYGAAWIGHFVFEKNHPATFIYPSYSLICDFRLLFDFYKNIITSKDPMTIWNHGITSSQATMNFFSF